MLTVEFLNQLEPNTIFGSGLVRDSSFRPVTGHPTRILKWVAVRGGAPDWAIYYQDSELDERTIAKRGVKLHNRGLIQDLMPCTEGALKRYRE